MEYRNAYSYEFSPLSPGHLEDFPVNLTGREALMSFDAFGLDKVAVPTGTPTM